MTATVLLVNPPIYDFSAYDFFNKPLGLLHLAGFLRQAGYHVRLLDSLDRRHLQLKEITDRPRSRSNGTGKYISKIVEKPRCLEKIPRNYRRYGMPAEIFRQCLAEELKQHQPTAVLLSSMMTYWYPGVAECIQLIRKLCPRTPIALGGVYATLMPEHASKVCKPDKLFPGTSLIPV